MSVQIKRVYEEPSPDDGIRILVDRLWPRGLKKEDAQLTEWLKNIAPSNDLRKWYGHDPDKWGEFQKRYFAELDSNPDDVVELRNQMRKGKVTLLYSSKEEKINNAVALKEYLKDQTG